MRVLFTACPMHGHVNTLLPLAVAARHAGHDVVIATGADLADHIGRHGLATWPVGPTHAEAGGAATVNWVEYFTSTAERRAVDLVPRTLAWRPDLVVSEETELAGPVAAAAAGARPVVHGLGLMPPARIWEALAPTVEGMRAQWAASGAHEVRDAPYLDVCPPTLQPTGERFWRSSRPIRPVAGLATADDALPPEVLALPRERTVHVTLGTVFHHASEVLAAAVSGLRQLPIDLVVTTGPGSTADALGPQPANVVLAPYLPHALLLPRCLVVVSQGGAGIMFGALAHGLPQLVLPQGAEQFMNADAAARSGAALVLEPTDVSAESVTAAVRRLLTEPAFTEAAVRVSREIAAMPDAATVLADLSGKP